MNMKDNGKKGEAQPSQMREAQFHQYLNQLVGDALTSGVPFAQIVALLEVSKSDVIEIWRESVRQAARCEPPLIVDPQGKDALGGES